MAIQHAETIQGNMLAVKAWGFDENLADVEAYGMAVIAACQTAGITRVLCDERELVYRLDTFDIFAAAETLAAHAPRVARTAIVANERFSDDAHFWETVAVNRGLAVRVFKDTDAAKAWLLAA